MNLTTTDPSRKLRIAQLAARLPKRAYRSRHAWSDEDDRLLEGWMMERPSRSLDWIAKRLRRPEEAVRWRWKKIQGERTIPDPLGLLGLS